MPIRLGCKKHGSSCISLVHHIDFDATMQMARKTGTGVTETGVEFMALISGANFCSVCHGHNTGTFCLSGQLLGNTPGSKSVLHIKTVTWPNAADIN